MKFDASLTELVVQLQHAIVLLTARVTALEAAEKSRLMVDVAPMIHGAEQPRVSIRKRLTIAMIGEEVGRRHGVTVTEMKSRTKAQRVSRARNEAFYVCKQKGFTRGEIGKFFGDRDQSTVRDGEAKEIERRAAL